MSSNSKLFKNYLHNQSIIARKSVKDVEFVVKCRNQWKLMPESDKLIYSNDSESLIVGSNSNIKKSSNFCNRSDTMIVSKEIDDKLFDALIKYKSKEILIDSKFFFMSSNIQCVVRDEYRPIEIGIIEYTIRDGICLEYQQFIDCGEIPFGHICEATEHMRRTHKIPLKNFMSSSKDYLLIGSRILEVLSDSCVDEEINHLFNKPMIVFSKNEQIEQNKGALKWIATKYNEMRRQEEEEIFNFNIHVLNATKLLSSLMTSAGDCHSIKWYENAITSHAFDYAIGTDCPYHEENQSIDCALGVPKRMSYLISHFLRKSYGMRLSAKHLPTVKAFENIRIREDDNEEPISPFILNEEIVIKKEQDSTLTLGKQQIKNEVNVTNNEYESDDQFFEVPRLTCPLMQRTQLSHIRKKGPNRYRIH